MSVGPLGGIIASAAGAPSSLASGSEVERASQDVAGQAREAASDRQAQRAAGIAEPDGQDHQTNDRDADGRRPWEIPAGPGKPVAGEPAEDVAPSKDATGNRGHELDLTG